MDLIRRDALAALSAAGVAVGAGEVLRFEDVSRTLDGRANGDAGDRGTDSPALDDGDRETLVALARTLYPGELSGIPGFVETYVAGRVRGRPDPDGVVPSRVRYYLVNDPLYALYASPTGGRLVGIENPQGHPGGIDSYRRGPDAGRPDGRIDPGETRRNDRSGGRSDPDEDRPDGRSGGRRER